MKANLLFIAFLLSSWFSYSQITAGQVDDFQDGTIQGWIIGNGNPQGFGTSVVSDAGPNGVGDNVLDYNSTGGGGVGSRMVVFNPNLKWRGNYLDQNIVAIKFDIKVEINDLNIKVAFQRGTNDNFTRVATSTPIIIEAGIGWTSVELPIAINDLEIIDNYLGDYTITEVLQDVSIIRILSNPNPMWLGESIAANIQLDNITASTTLNLPQTENKNVFELSPNPAASHLNINLNNDMQNSRIVVYDVLGKKVYDKVLNSMLSSIDISDWNSGVYLIRLTNNDEVYTKRFIKQ